MNNWKKVLTQDPADPDCRERDYPDIYRDD